MILLSALLSLTPRVPQPQRGRIDRQFDKIAEDVTAASEASGVPPSILLTVGFLESHLGVDAGEGGNYGAPVDHLHRHTAGTALHAARALARSYEICGTWFRAITRFRSGLCVFPRHLVGYEAPYAVRMIERIHALAGVPLPEHLR